MKISKNHKETSHHWNKYCCIVIVFNYIVIDENSIPIWRKTFSMMYVIARVMNSKLFMKQIWITATITFIKVTSVSNFYCSTSNCKSSKRCLVKKMLGVGRKLIFLQLHKHKYKSERCSFFVTECRAFTFFAIITTFITFKTTYLRIYSVLIEYCLDFLHSHFSKICAEASNIALLFHLWFPLSNKRFIMEIIYLNLLVLKTKTICIILHSKM